MCSTKFLFKTTILLGILLFAACKKDGSNNSDDPQSEYYFTGKLDGQTLLYELDASGNVEMVNSNGASIGPVTCSFSYGCSLGLYEPIGSPYIFVDFPDLFVGDCADIDQAFSGLFHIGNYGLGTEAVVSYWDGTEIWTSEPNGQSSPSFEVTASERQETPFGVFQKVTGRVSCLLFNLSGESKPLENAKFVMSFSKD